MITPIIDATPAPTIDELIAAALAAGWEWAEYYNRQMLLPPIGDRRRQWAAKWIVYKAGYYYPHWISRPGAL